MILRRLTKHVKGQNWFAVGLDFVIVVVGILIAFQITNWANENERREIEVNYTKRLRNDVMNLQEVRAPILGFRIRWNDGLKSANSVLYSEDERELTALECEAIGYSYIMSSPTDDVATLIELQSSGQLSLFRDTKVSSALQEFLLTRARARDANLGILFRDNGLLLSKYPDLIQVAASSRQALTPAVYKCDTEAMRGNQAFMNDYEIVQKNFANYMMGNNRVSDSLSSLHRVLDEVLGLTHKETP
jgi:hypothetical protein